MLTVSESGGLSLNLAEGLSRLLHGHEGESTEEDPGADCRGPDQLFVGREDPDQWLRDEHHQQPHRQVDPQAAQESEPDAR